MKNIIYLLVMICITYNFNLAQSGEGELPPLEIAVRTDNFNSTDIIRFQMEPIGSNWCSSNYIYYLTNSTVISNETVVGNYDLSGRGFNICSHNQGWEFFWDGFYKMTIYVAEQGGQETEKNFFLS